MVMEYSVQLQMEKKMELSRWDIAEAAPEYENNTLTNEDPKP